MDWLARLPIMNFAGPAFLAFYALVAATTLILAFLALSASDRSGLRPPPSVPSAPDPLELAYLSGGLNNVIRTILFDLRQRGLLELSEAGLVATTARAASHRESRGAEASVLRAVGRNTKISRLFGDATLRQELEAALAPRRVRLAEQELLAPEGIKSAARLALLLGSLVLVGLASAKIMVATSRGHSNIGFLVFLAFAAEAALFAIVARVWTRMASNRGRAYLTSIKRAYQGRLTDALKSARAGGEAGDVRGGAFQGGSLFLLSVFGFEILEGTAHADFAKAFRTGSSDAGGSCGSSDGGDSGGGCGGCGGGGD